MKYCPRFSVVHLIAVSSALGVTLLTSTSHAHPGHAHVVSFETGFMHPLLGVDHIAAMIAVGIWASQRRDRALWIAPVTFLGMMALAGIAGARGVTIPGIEPGIAASVLILGMLIATASKLPSSTAIMLIGISAVFHGLAHGSELSATTTGLTYGAGFIFTTALLHAVGIGAGTVLTNVGTSRWVRISGAAITIVGIVQIVLKSVIPSIVRGI